MSKTCARCEKSVYPTEELKCLDKVWHKTCFKCQTCNMALNMKTYKGYNKLPYCEAHIPKAKATTVTETPEMRRLAENTKLQSQVQYHADFEKAKGKFTQVADDPETLRIKANSKIISNVSYHGDLEKKAAMEQKRTLTGEDEGTGQDDSGSVGAASPEPVAEIVQHHAHRSGMPARVSPPQQSYHQQPAQFHQPQQARQQQHHPMSQMQQSQHHHQHPQQQATQPRQLDHKNQSTAPMRVAPPNADSPYSSRQTTSSTLVYSSQPNVLANQPQGRRVGSITDYDPVNENHGSLGHPPYRQSTQSAHQQAPYSQQQTQQQKLQQYYLEQQRQHQIHLQQQQQAMQQQQQQQQALQQQQAMHQLQQRNSQMQQQQNQFSGSAGVTSGYHQSANAHQRPSGRSYRAMYDYDADDDDEVSFRDGDVIVDCKSIDEGWMMGTVARTGRSGMVPANYIEPI